MNFTQYTMYYRGMTCALFLLAGVNTGAGQFFNGSYRPQGRHEPFACGDLIREMQNNIAKSDHPEGFDFTYTRCTREYLPGKKIGGASASDVFVEHYTGKDGRRLVRDIVIYESTDEVPGRAAIVSPAAHLFIKAHEKRHIVALDNLRHEQQDCYDAEIISGAGAAGVYALLRWHAPRLGAVRMLTAMAGAMYATHCVKEHRKNGVKKLKEFMADTGALKNYRGAVEQFSYDAVHEACRRAGNNELVRTSPVWGTLQVGWSRWNSFIYGKHPSPTERLGAVVKAMAPRSVGSSAPSREELGIWMEKIITHCVKPYQNKLGEHYGLTSDQVKNAVEAACKECLGIVAENYS